MKFLAVILLTTLSLALAKDKDVAVVRTTTFAGVEYHRSEHIGDSKFYLGFFIAGYILLGTGLIFAMIRIWIDEIERHKDYDVKLKDTIEEMNGLQMDVAKIDSDYKLILQGKDPNAEEDPDTVFQQENK